MNLVLNSKLYTKIYKSTYKFIDFYYFIHFKIVKVSIKYFLLNIYSIILLEYSYEDSSQQKIITIILCYHLLSCF